MADPIIINPTLTLAGQAAAFNASNDGLELKITHVSFGTAHYDPTGEELALVAPVGNKVPVAGASRPTPYQIRMVSAWREDVGQVGIGEIAFWAGDTLAFVWSKADGTVASYKTNGVTYVLFNDLAFSAVPANSISFVIDPDESVALAALAAHEGAYNAHPQYVLRAKFPDYQGHLWGEVGGTANNITLTLPEIVELTQYIKGNRFSFKALSTNTDNTTIDVEGVGPVQVLKTGGVPLTPGSIVAGGVYDVYYDGANFQLTAGAGFASAEATETEVTQLTQTDSTSWISLRRLIKALSLFAPLKDPVFSGAPKAPTAGPTVSNTQIATTAFVKAALNAVGLGDVSLLAYIADMNDVTIPSGIYYVSGGSTLNNPVPTANATVIHRIYGGGGLQIYQTYSNNELYWRRRTPTQWEPWNILAPLDSPAFVGNPTGPTPPQFDKDKSLATTEFVKRMGVEYSGFGSFSANTSLTAAHVGGLHSFSNAALITAVLPSTEGVAQAATIAVTCAGAGGLTVQAAAGDVVFTGSGQVGSLSLGLGDTAEFIRLAGQWRLIGGSVSLKYSAVMSGPNWTTLPQFDKDKSLATTEFVQREKGSYAGSSGIAGGNVTLTAAHVGTRIEMSANGTLTLPKASTLPKGSSILITTSSAVDAAKLALVAGDGLAINNVSVPTPYTMSMGSDILVVSDGEKWRAHASLECMRTSPLFSGLLALNGSQKLPSGLILQWGSFQCPANSTNTITLPVTFPNAFLHGYTTITDNVASVSASPIATLLPLGLSTFSLRSYYSASAMLVSWWAVGY